MRRTRTTRTAAMIAAGLLGLASVAVAQQVPAVVKGVEYLRASVGRGQQQVGETALAALAMIKAEVPPTDPGLAGAIKKIESRFDGSSYSPERHNGGDIYEASVVILALANLDANGRRSQIASAADYIISRQNANGSWDYTNRTSGDTSISQYAVLGLWEAENAGATVSPGVWDRAASWYLSTQNSQGFWTYHPDEGSYQGTISMTAAGVGSLLICQRQLAAYKRDLAGQNPYLIPVVSATQRARVKVETPNAKILAGARAGIDWIGRNFTTQNATIVGPTVYYALYGIERVGALAGRENMGRNDWYDQGARFIVGSQGGGGVWNGTHGEVPNTAWAILFLTKSTAKSVERIRVRRLGAGELFGGKGLPRDLSSISEAGGRLIARPMDGAMEEMLAVFEDPRANNADSALAGLLARYQAGGARALVPYRDRFRKLLKNPDPGVRRVAAWAIGRLGEIPMAPTLIEALSDPDPAVAREADAGLRLIGRKIDGIGAADPATPAGRAAAVKAWRAWYESVRPLRVDEDETDAAPTKAGQ